MSRDAVISLSSMDKQNWKEGWDELLDSSPGRPIFHRAAYPPRLSLNGLLVSLLSTGLLTLMGFIIVTLPSPLEIPGVVQAVVSSGIPEGILDASSLESLSLMQYSFQIPLALMLGSFLGPFMGSVTVLLFLVIGLFFYPVFANGGGIQYLTEPGFGYLLGMFFAASLLGRNFHKAFQKEDKTSRSLKLLSMSIAAVLVVHAVGILYLSGLSLLGKVPFADLPGWMLRLTVETAPYDMLATFVFLCLVRQLRLGLWMVLY